MNILVISERFYPEQFRINDICSTFVELGHSVTIITGLPNYPNIKIPEKYKIKENRYENFYGVNVVRVGIIPRGGVIKLFLNYVSFMVNACIKIIGMDISKFDIIYVYQTSPVTMIVPALLAKFKAKIPVLVYCCDVWPDSVCNKISNKKSLLFRCIKWLSAKLYQAADRIAITSKPFCGYLVDVCGVDAKNIFYIPQHCEDIYLTYNDEVDNDCVDFAFLGNIGFAQNCEIIIEAVERIKTHKKFMVHFVGDGSNIDKIKQMVAEKGFADRVIFHGRFPVSEMKQFYALADAFLLTLKSSSAIGLTMPSKLQGYMAAGKPIVAAIHTIGGAAQEVIHQANCGKSVDSDDAQGLALLMSDAIENFTEYKMLGKNGREYFLQHFTKDIFMKATLNQLEDMVENHVRK